MDECSLCSRWPKSLRPAMRGAIDRVPLKKPVCDECLGVFARGLPILPTGFKTIRLKGAPVAFLGYIDASDEKEATAKRNTTCLRSFRTGW